jgi:hypothetical protein
MSSQLGFYKLLKGFLTAERCKELINLLPEQNTIIPYTNEASSPGVWYKNNITEQRCTLSVENDILEKIKACLPTDNEYIADRMYVTKYDLGQLCKPHKDPADITIIILLNKEFEGGDLFVEKRKINLCLGDAIFFSNREIHHVSKITNGTRYALSIWLNIKQR